MDLLDLKNTMDRLNGETIPRVAAALESLVEKLDTKLDEDLAKLVTDLHGLLTRLSGVTITIHVPPRKPQILS